jgi:H+/Cl- antiporter ClcA
VTGQTFARDRRFWQQMKRAVWVGVATGVFALAFLGLIYGAEHLISGDDPPAGWFDGHVWAIPALALSGLIVAWLRARFRLPADHHGVFEELEEGRVEPRDVPGTVAVSTASLLAGAPLGPEAALGSVGGGLATWDSERKGESREETSVATQAGIGAAFGALISPFISGLLALELDGRPQARLPDLICTITGAVAGFAVFFSVAGSLFLGAFEIPGFELKAWHLLAAVGLGGAGAAIALMVGAVFSIAKRLLVPRLHRHPYATPITVGTICGVIIFALPLTAFSGARELEQILSDGPSLGIGLLIATLVAKMVASGIALNGGFIGGPLFPMLLIGGTAGVLVVDLIPGLPAGVAIPSIMAAIPAPLIGMPLSAVFLVAFAFGLGSEVAIPTGVAALTSMLLIRGLLRLPASS